MRLVECVFYCKSLDLFWNYTYFIILINVHLTCLQLECVIAVIWQFYKLYCGLVDSNEKEEIMICLFNYLIDCEQI